MRPEGARRGKVGGATSVGKVGGVGPTGRVPGMKAPVGHQLPPIASSAMRASEGQQPRRIASLPVTTFAGQQ